MKAIEATPRSVADLFGTRQYEIPLFQRPYTWTEPVCARLWEDLITHYDKWKKMPTADKEQYFLGSIIVYPRKDKDIDLDTDIQEAFYVVDGQQRLTTLALLMAALHCHVKDNVSLLAALHVMKNVAMTQELRVVTSVLEDDRFALSEIVNDMFPETIQKERVGKKVASRKNNFVFFREKIGEWYASVNKDPTELRNFINMLLRCVVMLPIKCDSREDAFTIFEVVNNRGKPLTDADIFKSNILQNLSPKPSQDLNTEQKEFLQTWEVWCKEEQEAFCFRALMRITKAQDGNTDSTDESILSYFQTTKREYFRDAKSLVSDLNRIFLISQWERPTRINIAWNILSRFPNESWKWPVYCYLFRFGTVAHGVFALPAVLEEEFYCLCMGVIAYVYGRGLIGTGTQTALKPVVYKECARIMSERFRSSSSALSLTKMEQRKLSREIDGFKSAPCYSTGNRFCTGLVFLSSYLMFDDEFNISKLSDLFNGDRIDVEHICPRNWSNADGWDEATHSQLVNTIGNLMPLEKAINIQVGNDSFWKKKTGLSLSKRGGVKSYCESLSPEARSLARLDQKVWLPKDVKARNAQKVKKLKEFFCSVAAEDNPDHVTLSRG